VHFPKNLKNVFPDLEGIAITNTKLKAITQDDVKVFPRLKAIYFAHNQLKFIKADTFKFNLKLEQISLFDNIINHIEPNTFDGLSKLRVLELHNNDKNCDMIDAITKSATEENIVKVNNQKCFSQVYELQQRFESHLKDDQEKIEKLENQIEQSNVLMSQMLIQIQVLTKKVEQLQAATN
jgi:ferritin-like metal-binding protein YciE